MRSSDDFLPCITQFGVYEWCMTDAWDPSNPEHKELAHKIELGNGIPEMRPLALARKALHDVGFEVLHEEDLADRPDEIPWYYPLEGDISKAQTWWDYFTVWRMSWSGKLVSHNAMRIMELVGMLPKGTWEVGEALKVAGDALVKGGQTKVSAQRLQMLCKTDHLIAAAVHSYVPSDCPETETGVRVGGWLRLTLVLHSFRIVDIFTRNGCIMDGTG